MNVEDRLQRVYTPLELEGRDIYIREGCYNCHSQMIRTLVPECMRYGDYSRLGESIYDHPFQWGSKRTGPDLAREGGRQEVPETSGTTTPHDRPARRHLAGLQNMPRVPSSRTNPRSTSTMTISSKRTTSSPFGGSIPCTARWPSPSSIGTESTKSGLGNLKKSPIKRRWRSFASKRPRRVTSRPTPSSPSRRRPRRSRKAKRSSWRRALPATAPTAAATSAPTSPTPIGSTGERATKSIKRSRKGVPAKGMPEWGPPARRREGARGLGVRPHAERHQRARWQSATRSDNGRPMSNAPESRPRPEGRSRSRRGGRLRGGRPRTRRLCHRQRASSSRHRARRRTGAGGPSERDGKKPKIIPSDVHGRYDIARKLAFVVLVGLWAVLPLGQDRRQPGRLRRRRDSKVFPLRGHVQRSRWLAPLLPAERVRVRARGAHGRARARVVRLGVPSDRLPGGHLSADREVHRGERGGATQA
jgi:hypothetical protein